ncbi:MAG: endonuclease MutS2 [Flavobacterium sp.]|nr:endonuclease MutS2 [Flavobacterium sp.]
MIKEEILDKLEFKKVLEFISKYSLTENGKVIIKGIKPFRYVEDALDQGNYVTEAKEILIKNDEPPFEFIPDLYERLSLSQVENTVLSPKSIIDIKNLASASRRMFQYFKMRESEGRIYSQICHDLFVNKNFENHIEKIFTENGDISDNASSKLREIRGEIKDREDTLRKVVNRILKQLSELYLVQEEYITQRDGRIVVPVKAEHKRHVKGFIHSESATGQTVYIEPEETLELNNDILSLKFAEKREIERILRQVTALIGQSALELKKSLAAMSRIDSLFALAKYSIEIIGAFPSIEKEKPFHLLNGKHPILVKKIGREKTIPLNLKIDKEKVILITGPNAGGKTVVLKTLGLLSLMVSSGIHIPADPDSNFHFFDKILIDIGDQQSIEDDLSTFSSHLTNIKNILKEADDTSLVLLDEIGTGTDPHEGSAIAAGVLITLRDKKATVFATTHHGSLKLVANDLDGFQNASMEFDTENLIPTYYFNQGIPGSSYAFEITSRIGFETSFIELAKQYLESDKSKIEELLVQLENKSQQMRTQLHKAEVENSRLTGLTNLYENKISLLEKQKKEILEQTKSKADQYLKDVNKRVEEAIKNIKEAGASKEVIKAEKKKIDELKNENKILVYEKPVPVTNDNKPLEIGSYAQIKNTTTFGTILEIDPQKNKATLSVGNLKLQVKLSDLLNATKKEYEIEQKKSSSYLPEMQSNRLDIRGRKPEECEYEIVRFIDEAYSSGTGQVEILHGKGTGVLKKTVHDILKGHHGVKSYHFAHVEFGGEGITIVEFR